MDPADLERWLDRELKELPPPAAPGTLVPRVMAAARQSILPWYRRPWVTWPAVLQTASLAVLAILVANLAVMFPWVQSAAAALGVRVPVPAPLADAARHAREGAALVNFIFQVFVQPVAAYFYVLAIAFALACSVLWSALSRVALGGAHQ